jgi:hypothetical protein
VPEEEGSPSAAVFVAKRPAQARVNTVKAQLSRNNHKLLREDNSPQPESLDGDLFEDLPPPIPNKSVKRLTEAFEQLSAQVRSCSYIL